MGAAGYTTYMRSMIYSAGQFNQGTVKGEQSDRTCVCTILTCTSCKFYVNYYCTILTWRAMQGSIQLVQSDGLYKYSCRLCNAVPCTLHMYTSNISIGLYFVTLHTCSLIPRLLHSRYQALPYTFTFGEPGNEGSTHSIEFRRGDLGQVSKLWFLVLSFYDSDGSSWSSGLLSGGQVVQEEGEGHSVQLDYYLCL